MLFLNSQTFLANPAAVVGQKWASKEAQSICEKKNEESEPCDALKIETFPSSPG